MTHPVVRWQIISPNPDATTDFYERLFGWSTTRANALGYREVVTGADGMDGGVWPGPPHERPFVQLFVAVPDVERHVARAMELGAKLLVPASVLPDGDSMALLLDPSGLPFGVCTMKPDVTGPVNC
jgi:predicted enzyme related to lactoylglutathione lyase